MPEDQLNIKYVVMWCPSYLIIIMFCVLNTSKLSLILVHFVVKQSTLELVSLEQWKKHLSKSDPLGCAEQDSMTFAKLNAHRISHTLAEDWREKHVQKNIWNGKDVRVAGWLKSGRTDKSQRGKTDDTGWETEKMRRKKFQGFSQDDWPSSLMQRILNPLVNKALLGIFI